LGKTNVIILNADQTFVDKKVQAEGINLPLGKDWSPSFTPGKSVFSERVPKWKFWRKERRIIIISDEAMKAFELEVKGPGKKGKIVSSLWTLKEKTKFIAKVIAKSKAAQKPYSNWQVIAILVGLAIIAVLQLLTMRGFRLV